MRKFLLGLVGIVCALFAVPSWAGCNLFDMSQTPYNSGELIIAATVGQTGFSTSVNTNYNVYRIKVQPNTTYTFGKIKASQPYWVVTDSSNKVLQTAQNNGGTEGVDITITTEASAKYLYLSVGINGTYKCDDILQLEQGDVATSYVPYNPNCGCDGTVVNYTSATGTVTQNGTPTPTNPITPVFYTQGNMVLRRVGDYADTYDATTGKITRRVGVKVLDGSENWVVSSNYLSGMYNIVVDNLYALGQDNNMSSSYSSHFARTTSWLTMAARQGKVMSYKYSGDAVIGLGYDASADNLEGFKSWLQQQYNAGTPVTVWYPLATEVVEDWPASQCQQNIRVATTKYVESQFSALNTALANAVATVNTVVTQTIAQAASIATLQSGKQTRPDETCPAGKKCLLVTDENNIPHWYEIVENAWNLPAGYTQLQYIESTGTQYIDTGVKLNSGSRVEISFKSENTLLTQALFGCRDSSSGTRNAFAIWENVSARMRFDYQSEGLQANTDISTTEWNLTIKDGVSNMLNGVSQPTNTPDTFSCSYNAYIFSINTNGTAGSNMAGSIAYCKIWQDGTTLSFDGVPCVRRADGVVGMYDMVSGQFFTNQGTGEFTAGPVVE